MAGREEERRRRAREGVDREVAQRGPDPPNGRRYCGVPTVDREGKPSGTCSLGAGQGTDHVGFGRCNKHGGNSVYEQARGAWLMAHALGGELDVSPWDALLGTVRRAAARSAWWHHKLGELGGSADEDFLPGGLHYPVMKELERADDFLAKTANMAIKAGIAEKLVLAAQVQATELFTVVMAALEPLGLSDEQMTTFRGRMRTGLLALEAGVIEGESRDE
jgi:hypothetical protein